MPSDSSLCILRSSVTKGLLLSVMCFSSIFFPNSINPLNFSSWFLWFLEVTFDLLSIGFLIILELLTDDFYSKVVSSLHLSKLSAFSPLLPFASFFFFVSWNTRFQDCTYFHTLASNFCLQNPFFSDVSLAPCFCDALSAPPPIPGKLTCSSLPGHQRYTAVYPTVVWSTCVYDSTLALIPSFALPSFLFSTTSLGGWECFCHYDCCGWTWLGYQFHIQ